MKPPPDTPEFARFTEGLKRVLSVSKTELDARIKAHKKSGKRLPKRSAFRVSDVSPKKVN
jgi:hypothetical protein